MHGTALCTGPHYAQDRIMLLVVLVLLVLLLLLLPYHTARPSQQMSLQYSICFMFH
jgi:hypothetical protein